MEFPLSYSSQSQCPASLTVWWTQDYEGAHPSQSQRSWIGVLNWGRFPKVSDKHNPNWMIFKTSTLSFMKWKLVKGDIFVRGTPILGVAKTVPGNSVSKEAKWHLIAAMRIRVSSLGKLEAQTSRIIMLFVAITMYVSAESQKKVKIWGACK